MRIAIVGAGAMGSVYAGLLGDAGNDVWAVDRWHEHIDAIRERGLRVEGASGDRVVRIAATTDPGEVGTVDLVVIATRRCTSGRRRRLTPLFGPDTVVLPIQNGLGSGDVTAEVLGDDRVVLGVVGGFGASIVAPGHAHHHGCELVRLGDRHGPVTERVERIAAVWRAAGFTVRAYDDVDQLVWEKLICNVCFSGTCTVLAATIGEVMRDPNAWSSPGTARGRPTRSPSRAGSRFRSRIPSRTPRRSARGFPTRARRCSSTGSPAGHPRSTRSTAPSRRGRRRRPGGPRERDDQRPGEGLRGRCRHCGMRSVIFFFFFFFFF